MSNYKTVIKIIEELAKKISKNNYDEEMQLLSYPYNNDAYYHIILKKNSVSYLIYIIMDYNQCGTIRISYIDNIFDTDWITIFEMHFRLVDSDLLPASDIEKEIGEVLVPLHCLLKEKLGSAAQMNTKLLDSMLDFLVESDASVA